MYSKQIFSVFLISTLAACASNTGKVELAMRTPEQRCMELEQKWNVAQQELARAEGRGDSSWLYLVTDNFNPLTNNINESLSTAKSQEMRTHDNYVAFGCMDLSKMQIYSAFNGEAPKQNAVEQKTANVNAVSYQPPSQPSSQVSF